MHRLFWKLFLSYWAVLVIFAAAVVFSAAQYIDAVRAREDAGPAFGRAARLHDEARQIAREGGMEGLRAWLERLDRVELVPVLLLDGRGNDVLGREVSPRFGRFAEGQEDPLQRWPKRVVKLPDGSRYLLIRDYGNVT